MVGKGLEIAKNRQRIQCNFDENEEWDIIYGKTSYMYNVPYRHRSLIQSADWKRKFTCFYLPDECDVITAVTVLYFIVTDTLYCKCRLIIYFKEHIVSNFV